MAKINKELAVDIVKKMINRYSRYTNKNPKIWEEYMLLLEYIENDECEDEILIHKDIYIEFEREYRLALKKDKNLKGAVLRIANGRDDQLFYFNSVIR